MTLSAEPRGVGVPPACRTRSFGAPDGLNREEAEAERRDGGVTLFAEAKDGGGAAKTGARKIPSYGPVTRTWKQLRWLVGIGTLTT